MSGEEKSTGDVFFVLSLEKKLRGNVHAGGRASSVS
jgi:hypothetical protein